MQKYEYKVCEAFALVGIRGLEIGDPRSLERDNRRRLGMGMAAVAVAEAARKRLRETEFS